MGSVAGILVLGLVLLAASTVEVGALRKEERSVSVGGKVVCQDCTKGWNEWVKGSHPLKGVKVGVMCTDERKKVVYYNSDSTDDGGQFEIPIRADGRKNVDEKRCTVKILSSPDPICNVPTDFGRGKSGAKLTRPSFVFRNTIKYVVGPFYFTTLICERAT
ncbi:Pistil-specific extensin-like protein [Nymphaea thermarum]|nr:Pistil-specific extensin-like protein [Nymphaea thermarum]